MALSSKSHIAYPESCQLDWMNSISKELSSAKNFQLNKGSLDTDLYISENGMLGMCPHSCVVREGFPNVFADKNVRN